MNKLFKNKALLIIAAVVVLVVVLIGSYLLLPKQKIDQNNLDANALPTQVPIPTITADSLGLTLKNGVAGQTVVAEITKAGGISTIDYELNYMAKNPTPNSTDRIPRAVIGDFNMKKTPVMKEIKLGTCSDFCHYDQDVTDIKITLKVTKTDGKVYQSQASLTSTASQ